MKVVIQNCATQLFLQSGDAWGNGLAEATEFPSALQALMRCHHAQLRNVRILMTFPSREYDVSLPVHDSIPLTDGRPAVPGLSGRFLEPRQHLS
ncbi:MAG TPA: hypothetical protein VGF13_20035 [Verrucomicrobiae bacterium]